MQEKNIIKDNRLNAGQYLKPEEKNVLHTSRQTKFNCVFSKNLIGDTEIKNL